MESVKLDWLTGTPSALGVYLVAVKLGPAAGVYDFIFWDGDDWQTNSYDGEKWDVDTRGDIVAFIDIHKFRQSLNIQWPEECHAIHDKPVFSENDDDLWSED